MGQLIYPFSLTPGQPENVNQLNSNLAAIQSVLNGNVDASNILDGSLGQAELDTQTVSALGDPVQAGVVGPNDGKVTFGTSATVNVAAGSAYVLLASGLLRRVSWGATAITVPVSATTRLDQIVVDNTGLVSRLAGTDVAGVTLANRTNAAALPTGSLRLADLVITTAGVVNDTTNNIRDRRPWARGAYRRIIRNSNAGGTSNYTTTSVGTAGPIDAANLTVRVECTGNPIRMTLRASVGHTTAGGSILITPAVDGALSDGFTGTGTGFLVATASEVSSRVSTPQITWDTIPAPGSHTFTYWWSLVAAGTGTMQTSATIPLSFTVEEVLRQNADNGTA